MKAWGLTLRLFLYMLPGLMEPTINQLPGSRTEIKFFVSPEEAKPYIEETVREMSENRPIPGFRPGKAPYDEIKKVVGEMEIWQYALEKIVRAWFVKTVLQNNIETVGSPEVAVDQLVPGQEIRFTCTVGIMPKLQKLEEVSEPFVEVKEKEVKDTEVQAAIEDLRKMRREEVIKVGAGTKEDLMALDMEMKKDGVALEGGTAKNYRVYLYEDHYIPKFTEQLLGLKKGDKKTFTLPFPESHYQKAYAGKDVDFEIDVKDVYEVKLPEVNDDFAKSLGVESAEKLRSLIKKNLDMENRHHAMEAAEIELLETLVKKSSFTEVPELLINDEVRRMFGELSADIENRGGRIEDYLSSMKKTADQIKLDMIPQAISRIQTALFIREIAKKNNIEVKQEELDAEIDRLISIAPDKETKERVSSVEYRDYVGTVMRNRKTLEFLKEKGIKNYIEIAKKLHEDEPAHEHEHVHGPECEHDHE